MIKPLSRYPRSALRTWCIKRIEAGKTLSDCRRELEPTRGSEIAPNELYGWLLGNVRTPEHIRRFCAHEVFRDVCPMFEHPSDIIA